MGRKKKIYPYEQVGNTMQEIRDANLKTGARLKLVFDYTFGMRHDKYKTATLEDPEYVFEKISDTPNYGRDNFYLRITDINGTPYSLIGKPDQKFALEIIK